MSKVMRSSCVYLVSWASSSTSRFLFSTRVSDASEPTGGATVVVVVVVDAAGDGEGEEAVAHPPNMRMSSGVLYLVAQGRISGTGLVLELGGQPGRLSLIHI